MIILFAICHPWKNFYRNGKTLYWYEFQFEDGQNVSSNSFYISSTVGFLKLPNSKYYECNVDHEEALCGLNDTKIIGVIERKENYE